MNQHLFKVSSAEFPKWLMLMWIYQHLPWFRQIASSKATTMGHIKRGHLAEAKVVIPDTNSLLGADQTSGCSLNCSPKIRLRAASSPRCAIPAAKLLSGKVRVAGDERSVS